VDGWLWCWPSFLLLCSAFRKRLAAQFEKGMAMLEFTDGQYLWMICRVAFFAGMMGWCLAWRQYQKRGAVYPPFVVPNKKQ
jgi:hypothetical protein